MFFYTVHFAVSISRFVCCKLRAYPLGQSHDHQPLNHQPLNHQPLKHQPLNHQPLNHQPLNHQPLNQLKQAYLRSVLQS